MERWPSLLPHVWRGRQGRPSPYKLGRGIGGLSLGSKTSPNHSSVPFCIVEGGGAGLQGRKKLHYPEVGRRAGKGTILQDCGGGRGTPFIEMYEWKRLYSRVIETILD